MSRGKTSSGGKELPKCPRCGAPYRSLFTKEVNGKKYVFAYHGKEGRRPVVCYLGPAEGYSVVEHLLALGLTNLEDVNLIEVAYNAASLYAAKANRLPARERAEAARELLRLAEDIMALAEGLRSGLAVTFAQQWPQTAEEKGSSANQPVS